MRFNEGGHPDHLSFAGLRGGGKGPSTNTTTNTSGTSSTSIPAWLDSASQGAVAQAQALAAQPYQPITGELVAPTTAAQNQAYQQVQNLQGQVDPAFQASQAAYTGLLGSATPETAAANAANTNTMYGNYAAGVVAPSAGLLGGYLGSASPATAGQVGSNALQLMQPYEQAVINPMLTIANQQLQQNLQGVAQNANNVGAYGGSRQGVEEGVAQAQSVLGTESNVANLLSSGYNAALTPAYNLANNASTQGYNAASLLAGQLGTGYANAQQQAGTIGANNLQAGLAAAQNLPVVAGAQQTADLQAASALQATGQAQQAQQQAIDNSNIAQQYAQQQYPYQSLDTLLSALGAVPYGTSTSSTGTSNVAQRTNPGIMNEITGYIGAIGSLAGGVAKAAG